MDRASVADSHGNELHGRSATDLLVVLSTPRSGSSYFCDAIRQCGLCAPREYFLPQSKKMALLAEEWGCVHDNMIDYNEYGKNLRERQSSESGWLGIKVHASHLKYFNKASSSFDHMNKHWIFLLRRDQIAQAISLVIAIQTKQWRHDGASPNIPVEYSFNRILHELNQICKWNQLIQAYVARTAIRCEVMYYEDAVVDLEGQLRRIPALADRPISGIGSRLVRQATARSAEWAQRFAEEYVENAFNERAPEIARQKSANLATRLRRRIATLVTRPSHE